ncbi:beta-glucosidase [Pedobacter yulinensis]|uniref:Beta-glucosidase n=1 Tax=Pedobacter yulinensis TaxID=2126353 RepID=A0A2T3HIL9_9SPHI|nr:glycoside hydrolase family 3 N-terminal domain-containing protein [Pedobacter yulinensis]PST82231.1 beta-glucosidase [Pedobacter yulinensis]
MKVSFKIVFVAGICLPLWAAGQQSFPERLPYRDASLSTELRVRDLLGRMTVQEKAGQLLTLTGWEMYTNETGVVKASDKLKNELDKRHIGGLWATLRADPWTRKTLKNGLNPQTAAEAVNAIQRYALTQTRLGIPLLLAEECAHGHMAIGATVFPVPLSQASTFNPALIRRMAAATALETRLQGANIGYGPILDLAREPRWSRTEETFGEDPFLLAEMGRAVVKGFQGKDLRNGRQVLATLKHFAAYGSPDGGQNGGSVTLGRRDLLENFLPPFEAAVRAGAGSVMTAYSSIDGVPGTADSFLLQEVLRRRWGFKGFTVSDLGSIGGLASAHRVADGMPSAAAMAINAGLDNDLGGEAFYLPLLEAIKSGKVTTARLDEAVSRVLRAKFELGLFENPYAKPAAAAAVNQPAHRQLAREVAAESLVLLKNEGALLPLQADGKKIAVIGPNADAPYNQLGDYTAPQPEDKVTTVLEGLRQALAGRAKITYVKGCAIRDTSLNEIAAAVEAAKQADVAVVVLGGSSARDFETEYQATGAATVRADRVSDMESGEGFDRASLDLMGRQLELLQAVAATGKPVVLVLIGGRPFAINWAAAHIPAILNAWYPGEQGGHAVADALLGAVNPSGKLPVSIPRSAGQLPVHYNAKRPGRHDYVELPASPLYTFGHGLSYTRFSYSGLSVAVVKGLPEPRVRISVQVKNTGGRPGKEVVQLYLNDVVRSTAGPSKQLKGFKKVFLQPGGQQTVNFELNADELSLISLQEQKVVEPGDFEVMIGSSAADIRQQGRFRL